MKTDKGILDVPEAAKLLKMQAPATMDELLQKEAGPSLNALVDAALKSKTAGKAFFKEDTIKYGPAIPHPDKIICIGLNYRKHAQEVGLKPPPTPTRAFQQVQQRAQLSQWFHKAAGGGGH